MGLRGLLIERDREVATIERRLADARAGHGGVVLIEAFAGKGKSRLLTLAGDMAREAGMQVLGAQATELERDFPFGVSIQLFEPRCMGADEQERARLLDGPARRAGELLTGALSEAGRSPAGQSYAVIHGLYWLTSNLVSPRAEDGDDLPLAILVDDAQWADPLSLRFLAYLAERVSELPIALIIAARSGEPEVDVTAFAALRNAADDAVLQPGALSEAGVAAVVRGRFPNADAAFCTACSRLTNGNPFLLTELLDEVQADDQPPDAATASRLAEMAPESVLNAVVARLGAMPVDASVLASAVAILGDGCPLRRVAALAELDMERAAAAADMLAATHMFHPGSPLSFVHPLVAAAVKTSMSPLEAARAHRRAASVLIDAQAPVEQIAAHLLVAPAESDPRAVEVLQIAARKALASGAAESAVRLLERALAEQPSAEVYPDVLAELAHAESLAGLPQAVERLGDAMRVTDERPRRAELALAQGRALYDQGRYTDAAEVLDAALNELEDGEALRDDLDAAYIAAAFFVPELADEARSRGTELLERVQDGASAGQRAALAHVCLHGSLRAEPRSSITQLANLAWGEGTLLELESADGRSWPLITGALLFVDELERDLEMCEAALEAARQQESPSAYAIASYCRAWPLYEQGRVLDAVADAQAALDARPDGWGTYFRTAYGALACCQLLRGQPDQVETALSIIDHPEIQDSIHLPFLLDTRAQLRLVQLRPADALADALDAGRLLQTEFADVSPGAIAWRSTAALAHLALGESERAYELASEELEQARRIGVTRVVIRNLRVLGLAERGARGIELLTDAVHTGSSYPSRLEHIHALIELGAALRRANQRAAAREPLRDALELSYRGGATVLAEHARTELTATGARPRRAMLSGVESLTPSERRVGELAARGLTTRQIAESLFVTPKTVEFHLRHIYRKLDIGSRSELTRVLGEA